MTPKHQNSRLALIAVFGSLLVFGAWLVFSALRESTQFFYNPSEVLSDDFIAQSEVIKIGGLVVTGSVVEGENVTTRFSITDFPTEDADEDISRGEIEVSYTGVLPDLFAEGDGVVVSGRMTAFNRMQAEEVLAKHDENYQPVK